MDCCQYYKTLIDQAINKVTRFQQLYKELEQAIAVSGKTKSTLPNYCRHLPYTALPDASNTTEQ
jgi:hypothetical protein